MTEQIPDPQDAGARPGRITGRHVFFGMCAFFAVVFAANGVMMWMAAETFDGVDEPDAYRRGVHYNDRLAEARAQRALGWRFAVDLAAAGPDERLREVVVQARDHRNQALSGLVLKVTMRSPVNAHEDRAVSMTADAGEAGRYVGHVRLPRLGKWRLELVAEDDAGRRWRGVFDLFLAGPPGRSGAKGA